MIQTLAKMKAKKGFTLMEMLIVVAIIAILAAIAIPVFSSQLTKAKEQTDAANLRTAESLAVADYMLNERSGAVTYTFTESKDGVSIRSWKASTASDPTFATGYNANTPTLPAKASTHSGKAIEVTVTDAAITANDWTGTAVVAPAPTPTPTPAP